MDAHVQSTLEVLSTQPRPYSQVFARTNSLIRRHPWRDDPETLLWFWRWSKGRARWCYDTAEQLPKSEYHKFASLNKQGRVFEGIGDAFKHAAGELLLGPGGGGKVLTYVNYTPTTTETFTDKTGVQHEITEDIWARFNPKLIQSVPL